MLRKLATVALLALALAIPVGCQRQPNVQAADPKSAPAGNDQPVAVTPPVPKAKEEQQPAAKVGDPLFKDWPKPQAVIVATGMQMGYFEPCGCSGKENQKGGLSRRHNMLKKLAADGWPVVPLDVGEQIHRFGVQSEKKFEATAGALKTMHYRAVALGIDDLRLPVEALIANVADVDKQSPSPFVAANVALFGFDQQITPRLRIIEIGKLKLGVTAVLGATFQKQINNDEIKFKPADAAIKEVLPEIKAAKCDRLILLAHATMPESLELAKQFPEFDFVITAGGAAEPPREPQVVGGTKTRIIEVGQKGMYANAIGLFDDPQEPVRFQRVPLDSRWGESDAMKQVMVSYQEQLKQLGLSGLGLKPAAHPTGQSFVGSKACGECHTKAFDVWTKTPHAHALDTLAKLDPPRNFDPECLSCHVTGWEPQKYYPFRGGFESLEKTPRLAHNGCENCHGPGSDHVAAESGDEKLAPKQAELRTAMRAAKSQDTCIQCHDTDNSLNFDFKTYWPKVEHHGKD